VRNRRGPVLRIVCPDAGLSTSDSAATALIRLRYSPPQLHRRAVSCTLDRRACAWYPACTRQGWMAEALNATPGLQCDTCEVWLIRPSPPQAARLELRR
jgi:hypothetical protein